MKIPPEMWAAVMRRADRCADIVSYAGDLGAIAMTIALFADCFLPPNNLLALQFGSTLMLLAIALFGVGALGAKLALRRARKLVIEYEGFDPEAAP